MVRTKRPLLLLVAGALSLSASGFAATGGVSGDRSPGRVSIDPPPHSNGHCGHRGGPPPCKNKQ
jgi:hypothetical protein